MAEGKQHAEAEELKANETVFAEGLVDLLKPVVEECDARMQDLFQSQSDLSNQIDALSEELSKFMDLSKTPSLSPYITKLNLSRSKMSSINTMLAQINARLDKIQKGVSPT